MNQTLESSVSKPGRIVQSWREQRNAIDKMVRKTRDWVATRNTQSALGESEMSERLEEFRSLLKTHFDCGSELYEALGAQLWCVEVDSAKRTAQSDHVYLTGRLDRLMASVRESGSSHSDFLCSVDELEWFFDLLDQHEEREADAYEWLLQASCD